MATRRTSKKPTKEIENARKGKSFGRQRSIDSSYDYPLSEHERKKLADGGAPLDDSEDDEEKDFEDDNKGEGESEYSPTTDIGDGKKESPWGGVFASFKNNFIWSSTIPGAEKVLAVFLSNNTLTEDKRDCRYGYCWYDRDNFWNNLGWGRGKFFRTLGELKARGLVRNSPNVKGFIVGKGLQVAPDEVWRELGYLSEKSKKESKKKPLRQSRMPSMAPVSDAVTGTALDVVTSPVSDAVTAPVTILDTGKSTLRERIETNVQKERIEHNVHERNPDSFSGQESAAENQLTHRGKSEDSVELVSYAAPAAGTAPATEPQESDLRAKLKSLPADSLLSLLGAPRPAAPAAQSARPVVKCDFVDGYTGHPCHLHAHRDGRCRIHLGSESAERRRPTESSPALALSAIAEDSIPPDINEAKRSSGIEPEVSAELCGTCGAPAVGDGLCLPCMRAGVRRRRGAEDEKQRE